MTSSESETDQVPIRSLNRLRATPVNDSLLKSAWERQRVYSRNATAAQARFFGFRRCISWLNVTIIFLSIIYSEVPEFEESTGRVLIVLPILVSGLLAYAVKYDRGNNWLLLRGNAEAMKTEIFYYLTEVGEYSRRRDEVLAYRLKLISERLKGSAVHQAALSPFEEEKWIQGVLGRLVQTIRRTVNHYYCKICDKVVGHHMSVESFKPQQNLLPEQYVSSRLEAQFDWYRRKSRQLSRQLQIFQSFVYLFGGLGTLLAALGYQAWVATTTAVTGAIVNYLEFKRVESTLVGYNQTADTLYDIRTWWISLPTAEQQRWKNFELLVKGTEETIRSEHTSWLHDMQDKLAQIYGQTDTGEISSEEDSDETDAPAATQNPSP